MIVQEKTPTHVSYRKSWVSKSQKKEGMIVDRKYDWVILDSTLQNAESRKLTLTEKLLTGIKRKTLVSFDGQKKLLPSTMTFILKCDTIQNFSPASLSDLALIHIDELCLDIDKEFTNWMSSLSAFSSFFAKNSTSSHLNTLYKKLIKPTIDFTMQGAVDNKLVFFLSRKYLLMHFMSFFEMFLNEARKIKIAFGQLTEEEIDEGTQDDGLNMKRAELHRSFFRRDYPSLQEESHNYSSLPEVKNTTTYATPDDILKIKYHLEGPPLDKLSFIIDKDKIILDSICIMSLTWTLGIAWNLKYRGEFAEYLLKLVHRYYGGNKLLDKLSSSPTCILNKFPKENANIQKKTVFDYCFDMKTQKWTTWHDLKLDEYPCITSDFQRVTLPVQELLKYNPELSHISVLKRFHAQKDLNYQTIIELGESILVETETVKSMYYFLDYLIAYKKPVLITSNYENGKSLAVRHKLKKLLEGNSFTHTNIAITPFTTQVQVKKHDC